MHQFNGGRHIPPKGNGCDLGVITIERDIRKNRGLNRSDLLSHFKTFSWSIRLNLVL